MAKKTTCPISRKDFLEKAQPIKVTINDTSMMAMQREFATGSLGWYLNGKMMIEIDGKQLSIQLGLNMTVVGSKELPKDVAPTHAPVPPA